MELVQELFVSGFLAVIFSLLIAKLVSYAISTDDHSTTRAVSTKNSSDFSDELVEEELLSREKSEVRGTSIEEVTAPVHERRVETVIPVEPVAPDNFIIKEEVKKEEEEEERRVEEIEDDWEGIERSELEKAFMEATRVMGSREGGEGRVELELYGLHKVATEGPCRENPPLALKLSARAKCDGGHWLHCARNAWQRLGNMSPEVAMEHYVALVSNKVPGWMEDKITREAGQRSSEAADSSFLATDLSTVLSCESKVADIRNPEMEHGPNKTVILTSDTSEQNRSKNEKDSFTA